ncbi:hypothetical protein FF100_16380 [Methylobacterium terricola]|uniref:Uncharacterized protein n=1 Tax=Methylobacterium terricola TaxID=2583531 RepID=A0A5C4LF39_9HYPH|nr:hypothetical protein FF100_16380 [Methylobacterium terricola]
MAEPRRRPGACHADPGRHRPRRGPPPGPAEPVRHHPRPGARRPRRRLPGRRLHVVGLSPAGPRPDLAWPDPGA